MTPPLMTPLLDFFFRVGDFSTSESSHFLTSRKAISVDLIAYHQHSCLFWTRTRNLQFLTDDQYFWPNMYAAGLFSVVVGFYPVI